MSAEEKAAFEQNMNADTKNAIDNQIAVRKVVKGDRLLKLKEQMIKDLSTKGTSNHFWKSFVLGSVIVATIATGGFLLWDSTSKNVTADQAETDKSKNIGKVSPEGASSSETFSNSENANIEETPQSANDVQNFENETTPDVSINKNEATIPTKTNGGSTSTSHTNDYAEPNNEHLAITEEEETSEGRQTNTTICKDVAINAIVVTIPTCKGDANGKIIVLENTITGGNAPYEFSINEEAFQKEGLFSKLSKGDHVISIKDSKGCYLEKKRFVSERVEDCINTDGHATFSPARNETFNFPLREDNSTVTVYNNKQQTVFSKTIKNKYHSSWDGIMDDGQTAQAGVYIFEVDAPSGDIIKGYLIVQ